MFDKDKSDCIYLMIIKVISHTFCHISVVSTPIYFDG